MKKEKPEPIHWLVTLYWWNPFVYVAIIIGFFYSLYKSGLKEYFKDVKHLFTNCNWR